MFLARVEGSVVATKKDASMNGRKLLLVRPQLVDDKEPARFRPGMNTIVAVDNAAVGQHAVHVQEEQLDCRTTLREWVVGHGLWSS